MASRARWAVVALAAAAACHGTGGGAVTPLKQSPPAAATPAEAVAPTARRPGSGEMDLLTAPAGVPVRMLMYDAGAFTPDQAVTHRFTDSLQVPVSHAKVYEIAAFAPGHAPLLVLPAWTAGRDTVPLEFRSTVIRLPLTVWVVQPPFDSTAKLVDLHLAKFAETWEAQGFIGLGDVRIVDATGFPQAGRFMGTGLQYCNEEEKTAIGWDEGRINAYYVGQTVFREIMAAGSYCGPGWVEVPPLAWQRPPFTTLAHEIGHGLLGGWHEASADNLMSPRGTGVELSEGQLFRAHFSDNSILNTMFGAYPVALRRPCSREPRTATPRCPPTDFVID